MSLARLQAQSIFGSPVGPHSPVGPGSGAFILLFVFGDVALQNCSKEDLLIHLCCPFHYLLRLVSVQKNVLKTSVDTISSKLQVHTSINGTAWGG